MLGSWDLNPLVLTETIEPSFIVKIVAVWAAAEKGNLVRFGAVARSEPRAWRRTHAGVPLRPRLIPIVEHPGISVNLRFGVINAAEQHNPVLRCVVGQVTVCARKRLSSGIQLGPRVMPEVVSPSVVEVNESIAAAKEDDTVGRGVVHESMRISSRRTHRWG